MYSGPILPTFPSVSVTVGTNTSFWIDAMSSSKYFPVAGEHVIGVVVSRAGECYRVDIGAQHSATLNMLAFEGATKKNRPDLQTGDLLLARVLEHLEGETELTCVGDDAKGNGLGQINRKLLPAAALAASSTSNSAASTPSPTSTLVEPPAVTPQALLTLSLTRARQSAASLSLSQGDFHVVQCSQRLCRRLVRWDLPVLDRLGQLLPFEAIVGANGRMCVRSDSARRTIALVAALLRAENVADSEMEQYIQQTRRLVTRAL